MSSLDHMLQSKSAGTKGGWADRPLGDEVLVQLHIGLSLEAVQCTTAQQLVVSALSGHAKCEIDSRLNLKRSPQAMLWTCKLHVWAVAQRSCALNH